VSAWDVCAASDAVDVAARAGEAEAKATAAKPKIENRIVRPVMLIPV
jgi:hypothetical protein